MLNCESAVVDFKRDWQPPSGGCVLKLVSSPLLDDLYYAAAFARLCVETKSSVSASKPRLAAAFGRLCVETEKAIVTKALPKPAAAFGWLCVETIKLNKDRQKIYSSRLRAAVC